MIARVAIDLALDRLFDYEVPESLREKLAVGQLLSVPFGHREARGFAVEIGEDASSSGRALKPISAIVEETPFFSPAIIALVRRIAAYTAAPLESVFRAALPAAVLKRNARAKEMLFVEPVAIDSLAQGAALFQGLTTRQRWLYEQIVRLDGGWMAGLCSELKTTNASIRALAEKGFVEIVSRAKRRNPLARRRVVPSRPLALNGEQAAALASIKSLCDAAQLGESANCDAAQLGARASSPANKESLDLPSERARRPLPQGSPLPQEASSVADCDAARLGERASPPADKEVLDLPSERARRPLPQGASLPKEALHSPGYAEFPDAMRNASGHFFSADAETSVRHHNLPHWGQRSRLVFVTFRLADSLPAEVLAKWSAEREEWLSAHPEPWDAATAREYSVEFPERLEHWLDAGHGSCVLAQEDCRSVVSDALLYYNGKRYRLHSYVIMPNHVHMLLEIADGDDLSNIIRDWKSFTSKAIGKLLGSSGTIWQSDYFDRLIRNGEHYNNVVSYIRKNARQIARPADCEAAQLGERASPPADKEGLDFPSERARRPLPQGSPLPQEALPQGVAPPPSALLLHGVTGSGKTEVYLQAIAAQLEKGRGAIVLVPEIALTPQTVQRFASRFGDRVAVLHSALSDGERYDEWHRIRRGDAHVVVGPRSAVFAPVANLGLIVVDEEHEPSYKQEDNPRYNARDVAVLRGSIEGAAVVLGSATPSLESWLNAQRGKYARVTMMKRAGAGSLPDVRIVNMAMEPGCPIFSGVLLDAIRLRLDRGEQTILFLNRRGWARSVNCEKCGHVVTCPSCDLPYTYHRADNCLRCHVCGGWAPAPERCPACGSANITFRGMGTQRVEAALAKCFPRASILRMDADSTSRRHSHDDILSAFRRGDAQILLGTQMIAKGLDFPNVTLVGVLNADSSLNMPDFRAAERTFQLLAQVSGRAGRAELPGEVVVQSLDPSAPAIVAAARGDYAGFAERELKDRSESFFPPYCHLAIVGFRSQDIKTVSRWSDMYAQSFMAFARRKASLGMHVSEAVPSALEKADGWYRWQIVLRARSAAAIISAWRWILACRPPPGNLRVAIDMDAQNLV